MSAKHELGHVGKGQLPSASANRHLFRKGDLTAQVAALVRLHELATDLDGQIELQSTIASIRDAATEALHESERRYRNLIQALPAAVYTTDAEGHVTFYNEAAVALWGRSPAVGEEQWCGSYRMYEPDGAPLPLDRCPMAVSLKQQLPLYAVDAVVERPDGTRRDVLAHPTPIHDASGAMIGAINVLVDITERKQAERALRQANEALKDFAYAAAHDLQEPLRNVLIYSQMLAKRLSGSLDQDTLQFLRYTVEGAKRMQTLVSDLLTYTRLTGKEEEFVLVDTADIVRQVLEILGPSIKNAGASIVTGTLPVIVAHECQLLQLFQNLLSNALKYRRPEVPLQIEIKAEKQPGEWKFLVSDNGIGIDPAHHQQIFGVFKRLHGSDIPGTGIGLAICRRVIEQYGGRIWVESQGENRGSTFAFTIPQSNDLGSAQSNSR
jgi:signal transduction histidine kinase